MDPGYCENQCLSSTGIAVRFESRLSIRERGAPQGCSSAHQGSQNGCERMRGDVRGFRSACSPFNSRQWRWYRQCVAKTQSISDLAGQFHRWLGGWIERNPEGAARIALWIEEQTERSDDAAPIDLLKSFMDGLVPRNWWPLRLGMHLQAQSTMAESGICLVWVPPTETVEAIVCVPSKEERDRVLLANAETILEALDQALGEATHPELTTTVEAAREAVDTYRDGRMRGAQTLAAATLGEVVEGHFGFEKFSLGAPSVRERTDQRCWSLVLSSCCDSDRDSCCYMLRSEEPGLGGWLQSPPVCAWS